MKARFPRFDFSTLRAHWSRVPEFAQSANASSLVPAHIEPYLLKVMRKTQPLLKAKGAPERLQEEVDIFCKQEMQHCKQHIAFNNRMHALGYEALKPLEAQFVADLQAFLDKRSLRFNMAYCEGFESISASACLYYFEDYLPYLEGADPEPAELWKWHLAEEYEHRSVCFDVFHELSGLDPVSRYFYRVYGYFYAMVHIGKFVKAANKILNDIDRTAMTAEQVAASDERGKQLTKVMLGGMPAMVATIVAPWYNPANRREPRGYREFLARLEDARCPAMESKGPQQAGGEPALA